MVGARFWGSNEVGVGFAVGAASAVPHFLAARARELLTVDAAVVTGVLLGTLLDLEGAVAWCDTKPIVVGAELGLEGAVACCCTKLLLAGTTWEPAMWSSLLAKPAGLALVMVLLCGAVATAEALGTATFAFGGAKAVEASERLRLPAVGTGAAVLVDCVLETRFIGKAAALEAAAGWPVVAATTGGLPVPTAAILGGAKPDGAAGRSAVVVVGIALVVLALLVGISGAAATAEALGTIMFAAAPFGGAKVVGASDRLRLPDGATVLVDCVLGARFIGKAVALEAAAVAAATGGLPVASVASAAGRGAAGRLAVVLVGTVFVDWEVVEAAGARSMGSEAALVVLAFFAVPAGSVLFFDWEEAAALEACFTEEFPPG